jgi:hypothetical protein
MSASNLDPKPDPRDSPDTPEDDEPDTVATPEGDAEDLPDVPLKPAPEGLQRIRSIDTNKL